ncbi:MAG TPA: oxygenase MpaB family protein [Sphingomonas sp.]|jgi:uncharacterized protein (DUF2236 family)
MNALRDTLADRLRGMVGSGEGALDLTRPPGDDGLFGPHSAAWKVHGDFTSMMIGGTSALLLQMLHPGALGGVWDHSDFRENMGGRLKRTAQFVAGTTYGSTATATRLIAKVRRIHDHVTGILPDGTPYAANDPALLTWVHVGEARSFLAAYMRYRDPGFPAARQEQYHREMAVLARAMGAGDVPATRADVEGYFHDMRPRLLVDDRTRSAARALLEQPAAAGMAAAQRLLLGAGVELLPPWAARMHGLSIPALARPAIRAGARGTAGVLRWALAAR